MANQHLITADELRALLHYDAETGVFTSRATGKPVGTISKRKSGRVYRKIGINYRQYYAHRLAWLYVKGEWPKGLLDHRDGDGLHNRFENLREATGSQNNANRRTPAPNRQGKSGLLAPTKSGTYRARIQHKGKCIYLGTFPTAEAAHDAYKRAAQQYFGDFAPSNGVRQ